jgi:hypothetical protein
MVMFTHKEDLCLAVSLSGIDKPAPFLNLDPFSYRKVTRTTDPRVFGSPLGHWIHDEVTVASSHSRRTEMI